MVSTLIRALVPCFIATSAWAAGPRINFDIPADDAKQALQVFISQANVTALYQLDTIEGITTNEVRGHFDAEEALAIMLRDTDLQFGFEDGWFFIKPTQDQASGDAQVVDVPEGAPALRSAPLDDRDERVRRVFGEQDLQQVVITGTMIRGVLDIMSPLEIIGKRDMGKTAYATVQDAVQALMSNSGGTMGEDTGATGNFIRGTGANLRGLGNGATLVLVNGRRQPFSGIKGDFVDLSSIPWSAVERIEVLPDGASALYGSDAIAGVVNIIMRSDFSGSETQLRAGGASGGASEKLLSQLFGTEWTGGSFLVSYQYATRSGLAAADRAYSATTDKREFGGSDFRSFLSSPGNVLDPISGLPAFGIDPSTGTLSPDINLTNRFESIDLLPMREAHNLYFSANQAIGSDVELFGEGRVGRREVSQRLVPMDQVLAIPNSNPFVINPFPAPITLVGYSFIDDLGPVQIDAEARTYTANTGAKIRLSPSWSMTAAASYGIERMEYDGGNQVDPAKLSAALADPNPGTAFNAFGGANNPATLASIRATFSESVQSAITSGSLLADGTLASWSQGDVRLALGGEWRREQLSRSANRVRRGSFDRQIQAAFAELSVPLVGDAELPRATPRLELSLASRYERYSDFGDSWNPKIGLRWAPSEFVKLRTSWGTSFRAPNLFDLHDKARDAASLVSLTDPTSPTGSTLILGFQGSNPNLKEETASTWTAGIDLAPTFVPNMQMSMTYYSITYKDRIVVPGPTISAQILLEEDRWRDVILRNPSASEIASVCESGFFRGNVAQCRSAPVGAIVDVRVRNLASTTVHGIDLKIDQSFRSALGMFQFGLAGNYALKFLQGVASSSPAMDVVGTVGNPLRFRIRGTADWYQRAWDQPGFGVNLTLDHAGGYRDSIDTGTRRVDDYDSLDLRLSYRTSPNGPLGDVEIALNGSNVLNESPPFVNREAGYDLINADPYGRVVSFSLQKTW